MKHLFLLFVFLINQYAFSQDTNFPYAINNLQEIISQEKKEIKAQIYVTDIETLDKIIKSSHKKYKIVYFLSDKCSSSIESFPKLIEYINKFPNDFQLFPVIGHRYSEIANFKEYLDKQSFYQPTYILDTEKYGNKKNPFRRLDMLTSLCKECDIEKMGFSSFFVIDNNGNIVLHNNWNIVGLEKIEQLKKLPLTPH